MDFPDNSFDFVGLRKWGTHARQKRVRREMAPGFKAGRQMVIATWCQRDNSTQSSRRKRKNLYFLYGVADRILFH